MNILDEIKDDETKIIELKEELPKENLKWLKTIIGLDDFELITFVVVK